VLLATAGVAGAAMVNRMMARKAGASRARAERWHVITVYRPADEIAPDALPDPLTRLGADVEVQLRPAPADRGTEIAARASQGAGVSSGDIRRALRESRSLLEVGEVLLPSGPPSTTPTPTNKPLRAVTARAREEGLL